MNILQMTHLLPWPPVDGGKKATLGFVEGYRRHPAVSAHTLLSMCPQSQAQWAAAWTPAGEPPQIDIFDTRNRVLPFLASTLFSPLPYTMAKYRRRRFADLVSEAVARRTPDFVHFDGTHMAAYAPLVRRLAPRAMRLLRSHNAEYTILERYAQAQSNPLKRALLALQARRLKQYEACSLDDFDLILAITDEDAARYRALNPAAASRIVTVPAGADIPSELPPAASEDGTFRMIHVAAMDWLPNQLGLRWLLSEVMPLLEGMDYRLDVIGKGMPEEFQRWSSPRIQIHGFVEDLAPFTQDAQLALVPLHVGGGMRVKILDYWSQGIPVLATPVGAEGLTGDGAVALADAPADFAVAIRRLSADIVARQALRLAGFAKVRASYGWPALVDRVLNLVAERRGRLA